MLRPHVGTWAETPRSYFALTSRIFGGKIMNSTLPTLSNSSRIIHTLKRRKISVRTHWCKLSQIPLSQVISAWHSVLSWDNRQYFSVCKKGGRIGRRSEKAEAEFLSPFVYFKESLSCRQLHFSAAFLSVCCHQAKHLKRGSSTLAIGTITPTTICLPVLFYYHLLTADY